MDYEMRFSPETICITEKRLPAGVSVADAMREINASEEMIMRCADHLKRMAGEVETAVLAGRSVTELIDVVPSASDMMRAVTARRIAYGMLTLAAGPRESAELLERHPPPGRGF